MLCYFFFQKIYFTENFSKNNFYCDIIQIILGILSVLIFMFFFLLKSMSDIFLLFYNDFFYLSLFLLIFGFGINDLIFIYEFNFAQNYSDDF